jgi:hypothetical protein
VNDDWLPALMREQMAQWEREHGDLPATWENVGDLSAMSVRAMESRAAACLVAVTTAPHARFTLRPGGER